MPDLDLSLDDIKGGGVLSGILAPPVVQEAESEAATEPPEPRPAAVPPATAAAAGARVEDDAAPEPADPLAAPKRPAARRQSRPSPNGRGAALTAPTPRRRDVLERATRQTSITLDPELLGSLDAFRSALGESQNAVLVAVLRVGLPASDEDAVDAMLTEKYEHQVRRVEQNVRLPLPLLDRVDELVAPAREQDRTLTRAHLVNAALRAGMPETVDEARKLMANQLKARISVARSSV